MRKICLMMTIAFILVFAGCTRNDMPNVSQTVTPAETTQPQTDIAETNTNGNNAQAEEIPKSAPADDAENTVIFGKVKNIIGNEIELELGNVPDLNEVDSAKFKKFYGTPRSDSLEKIELVESTQEAEDYIAPDPDDPIFGADGRINLVYAGEFLTVIIPAGINIHNRVSGAATLENIKKGSVLMLQVQMINDQIESIEMLTILE